MLLTDGLPFTSEEHDQAKSILSEKFGRPNEVINDHI